MEKTGLCIIADKNINPLKGALSYYNFFLKGEITNLFYKKLINLNEKEKIVLFQNNICAFIPSKIIFFINFSEDKLDEVINKTVSSLKLENRFIIRG
jgi:hypothetical protein